MTRDPSLPITCIQEAISTITACREWGCDCRREALGYLQMAEQALSDHVDRGYGQEDGPLTCPPVVASPNNRCLLWGDVELTLDAADDLPRIDSVYFHRPSGAIMVVKGVPAFNPNPPDPVAGGYHVADVARPAYSLMVVNADIIDRRTFHTRRYPYPFGAPMADVDHVPHQFRGASDRWCETCNRPDRDPIHVPQQSADADHVATRTPQQPLQAPQTVRRPCPSCGTPLERMAGTCALCSCGWSEGCD